MRAGSWEGSAAGIGDPAGELWFVGINVPYPRRRLPIGEDPIATLRLMTFANRIGG